MNPAILQFAVLFLLTFPQPPLEVEPERASTTRSRLDAIRDDLVELRFEQALTALAALLGAPALSPEERVEAWILRSQTHAAFGDFVAAEADYREILLQRPAWAPDNSLTPTKAMKRYKTVRDGLIGNVRFILDPADASLWIDGRERAVSDALSPLPAGSYSLRVERHGFDPHEGQFEIEAGKSLDLELSLIPNARTVVLRTEPDGVEVWVDGALAGLTARAESFVGAGSPAAELVLEDLPLGEHRFEFRKPCHRDERFSDALNVDLLDRTPKRYDTIRLSAAFAVIEPHGAPAGSEMRVDGEPVASLPVEAFNTCPGEREFEVVYAERIVWRERRTLSAGAPLQLTIRPRPNLALVGLDALPRELAGLARTMNLLHVERPASLSDLSDPESWERLRLDRHVDLAIAAASGAQRGTARNWWLHSPILGTVATIGTLPDSSRPAWTTRLWGLQTVDAAGPLVVSVAAGGGAEASGVVVGSRIVSVDGQAVDTVAALEERLAAVAGDSAAIAWTGIDGRAAAGDWAARSSPWLQDRSGPPVTDALRVAWAVSDGASEAPNAASALANLALIFGRHGEHELAIQTWKRVRWPQRPGIGAGTVAYYLGRELQALGQEREAIVALRRALATSSTAGTDAGAPVAPAARDRLADLGVASD